MRRVQTTLAHIGAPVICCAAGPIYSLLTLLLRAQSSLSSTLVACLVVLSVVLRLPHAHSRRSRFSWTFGVTLSPLPPDAHTIKICVKAQGNCTFHLRFFRFGRVHGAFSNTALSPHPAPHRARLFGMVLVPGRRSSCDKSATPTLHWPAFRLRVLRRPAGAGGWRALGAPLSRAGAARP